ncbi:MAG: ATP-binding protein [Candidatus Omnitrophota bacterium]|nr:ATP-binding protein [Candidatus Omnitrophota bacterium]
MDIRIILTRAGIFLSVYLFVLGTPLALALLGKPWLQELLGLNWYWGPLGLAILLASVGPIIYQKLRKKAEDLLLKEQKQYQEALLKISHTMILIKELERLLKTIVSEVVDIVQVSCAGIYLKDERAKKYILKHQKAAKGQIALPKEFSQAAPLVARLQEKKLPLRGDEPEGVGFSFGLAVPCFLGNNMAAVLFLGEKPKSSAYTQDDINVFTVLSNETALAIENCQLYTQERQHQHYLRIASLDRQMAGLAHEIDNPNYALLGSLGSLELALNDLKESIPADKLDYLKNKIERARFNSKRISKMIASVREFSRASSGEIKPIKFEWIMEGFSNIIEPQFKYNGINSIKEVTDEPIWLRANKIEIEQVLVNLGTNSVQAINEIWQRGENTPESRKEIAFRAYKIGSTVLRIDFSDTGSGIEKELLEDCFLDFVTTKGSSEGTGLGLSISRKNIQKHDGKIWADSEGKNKGTTIHIELPIANDLTNEEKQGAEIERGGQGKKDVFIQDFPK